MLTDPVTKILDADQAAAGPVAPPDDAFTGVRSEDPPQDGISQAFGYVEEETAAGDVELSDPAVWAVS